MGAAWAEARGWKVCELFRDQGVIGKDRQLQGAGHGVWSGWSIQVSIAEGLQC